MPICEICKREFVIINNNHLRTHNTTLDEYIEKYGDPNVGAFGGERSKASPRDIKKKIDRPKKTKKALSYQAARTIDELYELDTTIRIPDKFICITESNRDLLDGMLRQIDVIREISLDTETTGLDPFEDLITDIIITIHKPPFNYNYHIPFYHITKDAQSLSNEQIIELFKGGLSEDDRSLEDILIPGLLNKQEIMGKLKPMLEDPDIKKNLFNDYFDAMMLWGDLGINLAGVEWDGLIAAYILNENEKSHKLKDLYRKYLHNDEPDPQIKALGVDTYEEQFGKIRFFRVPLNVATAYAAKDGYMTSRLKEFQKPYIDSVDRLKEVFYDIEMPLIPILVEMRKIGIGVDLDFAKELEIVMKEERSKNEKKLKEVLGDINFNSPKQLSEALFKKLRLPDLQKGSTKAEVLQELADRGHEIADVLLDYKKSEKLISTYLEGLPSLVCKRTGRVHGRFNQMGARTGRFSSSQPNLQNIPARNKLIRKVFRADPGKVLISVDYSQIEPRVLSHVADEDNMISAYMNDRDIYSSMASFVFTLVVKGFAERLDITRALESDLNHYASPLYRELIDKQFIYKEGDKWIYKDVTVDDCYDGSLFRRMMKTILLGMMYSMSDKGLSSRLDISEDEAKEIMDYFFKAFPGIRKSMRYCERYCMEAGFIETLFGRKRRLPEIWSDEWFLRNKAKRQTLNSLIQGSSADILKLAMIKVGNNKEIKNLGGRILLTVHDELIIESPIDTAIEVTKLAIEDMTSVCSLKVPLKVDGEIFIDGRWYGESIGLKRREGKWIISKEELVDDTHIVRDIKEVDIEWKN